MQAEATRSFAGTLSLRIDAEGWARLDRLVELWSRYGRAMNLTGDPRPAALWRHVQDGLATVACARALVPINETTAWLDIGSGGGFPGLVVAAVTPCRLTLVEPRQRRAAFLELALAEIGRPNSGVRQTRITRSTWEKDLVDKILHWEKAQFRVLTARAVWEPAEWLELGMARLRDTPGAILAHLPHDANPPTPSHAQTPTPLGTIHAWQTGPR